MSNGRRPDGLPPSSQYPGGKTRYDTDSYGGLPPSASSSYPSSYQRRSSSPVPGGYKPMYNYDINIAFTRGGTYEERLAFARPPSSTGGLRRTSSIENVAATAAQQPPVPPQPTTPTPGASDPLLQELIRQRIARENQQGQTMDSLYQVDRSQSATLNRFVPSLPPTPSLPGAPVRRSSVSNSSAPPVRLPSLSSLGLLPPGFQSTSGTISYDSRPSMPPPPVPTSRPSAPRPMSINYRSSAEPSYNPPPGVDHGFTPSLSSQRPNPYTSRRNSSYQPAPPGYYPS